MTQSVDFHNGMTTITADYSTSEEPESYDCLRFNFQDGNLEFYDEHGKLLKAIKPLDKKIRTGILR